MQKDEWAGGEEIEAPAPELEEKECEGKNCLNTFMPTWRTQRRCERCRRDKVPYKEAGSPF